MANTLDPAEIVRRIEDGKAAEQARQEAVLDAYLNTDEPASKIAERWRVTRGYAKMLARRKGKPERPRYARGG